MSKATGFVVVLAVSFSCAREAPQTSPTELSRAPEEVFEVPLLAPDSIEGEEDVELELDASDPSDEASQEEAEDSVEEPEEEGEEVFEVQDPDPGPASDSAFESDSPFNDVIGIGGGAGGKFGGVFRGRKNPRASAGSAAPSPSQSPESSREAYAPVHEPGFRRVAVDPLSTFSIDVDTASYANVRRFLQEGTAPPPDSVRIEELLNAFRYDDPAPSSGQPFAVSTEVASCPWAPSHRLLRIGIRATELALDDLPPANLVFLIDVSGSMQPSDRLPLLVRGLRMLVEHLNERDRVAIVVYAGSSGLVLPSTPCSQRALVLDALERLEAGGSTAGAAGIQLAYQVARENLIAGGTNRVVLATDGDFNVGISDRGALEALIREEAHSGVYLSVLGFGRGNLQDSTLETLADRGNGNYAYVDSLQEARRVLVEELGGTLVTVARDVKIQLEFNPLEVQAWRQIGYENRVLAHSDFRDDTKDAGEIGAGHSLTALYELVPVGVPFENASAEGLRYQTPSFPSTAAGSGELLHVALRWKPALGTGSERVAEADTGVESETTVRDPGGDWAAASDDFRFAASVAAFGLVLRSSEYRGAASLVLADELAREALGEDAQGMRSDYVRLLATARGLGL